MGDVRERRSHEVRQLYLDKARSTTDRAAAEWYRLLVVAEYLNSGACCEGQTTISEVTIGQTQLLGQSSA